MISGPRERLAVIVFACVLLALYVGLAFAAGWLFGTEML
jgi:hypothetical protein